MIPSRPAICACLCALAALVACSSAYASTSGPPVVVNPGGSPQPTTSGSTSKYKVHIKQSPEPAYVDDPTISISWNVERTLEKKNFWYGELEVPNHERGIGCAGRSIERSYEHTKRGKIATITFILPVETYEWCAGRTIINISVDGGQPFLEIEDRIFTRP